MGNFLKSSEFANAGAALAQSVLAGQPNATSSAAYHNSQGLKSYAQGLAYQEAKKKADEEKKKQKKGALGGKLGATLAGIALAPVTAGMSSALAAGALTSAGATAGGMLGSSIAGGSPDLGDSFMQYGAQPLISGAATAAGNHLVSKSTAPAATSGTQGAHPTTYRSDHITNKYGYSLGTALQDFGKQSALGGSLGSLKSQEDDYSIVPDGQGGFVIRLGGGM